jgi:hypothetical protein
VGGGLNVLLAQIGELHAAGGLASAAPPAWVAPWDQHLARLNTLRFRASRTQLLLAFMAVRDQAWEVPQSSSDKLFDDIVRLLAWQLPRDGVPPLLLFSALVPYAGSRQFGKRGAMSPEEVAILNKWIAQGHELCNVPMVSFESQRRAAEQRMNAMLAADPALLIAIKQAFNKPGQFFLGAWVWIGADVVEQLVDDPDQAYTLEEIQASIGDLRSKALRHLVVERWPALTLELFLPRALLSEPVQTWTILAGLDEDTPTEIFREHRVVVRSGERGLSATQGAREARAKWRARWPYLADGIDPANEVFVAQCAQDFGEDIFGNWLMGERLLLYVEGAAPPANLNHAENILKRLIEAGLPLGVWLRPDQSAQSAYSELLAALKQTDLRRLRELARDIWRSGPPRVGNGVIASPGAAALSSLLVLFHDDPHRMPYDPDELDQ